MKNNILKGEKTYQTHDSGFVLGVDAREQGEKMQDRFNFISSDLRFF